MRKAAKMSICGDKCVFRARIPNAFCIQNTARNTALCTQRKTDYFMMKYWIERARIL